jgi:tRNA (guanine37-N1)-methyltransferase
MTGGELGALVVIDAVSRLIPGVLGSEESSVDESFSSGLLEYPQYTRPRVYRGLEVPEVLLNGHHKHINDWRRDQALKITRARRPDLLAKDQGSPTDE